MAVPKKLTRADVYKQIDAFRGIAHRSADGKPTAEEWVAAKHVETKSSPRRPVNGRTMTHGWIRLRVD
jgi:hypothetical protein